MKNDPEYEALPDGWWQDELNTQMNRSVEKEIISTQNENTKKERKFQYKKSGKINKAEEK